VGAAHLDLGAAALPVQPAAGAAQGEEELVGGAVGGVGDVETADEAAVEAEGEGGGVLDVDGLAAEGVHDGRHLDDLG
jgi:hypothetical protein